ncbi:MAG: MFS transporter [Candidatus Zixiibacteriota bacterium]|nr:MAG: MFS transporter [candidate division Zixibacteria bacterium]
MSDRDLPTKSSTPSQARPSSAPLESAKTAIADYIAHVRLFSRNARLYLLGSFLMGINFHVFQLLLNLYLKQLGFVEGEIGLVVSSRAVGMTLIAIPAAVLMSRVKLKPLLLASCLLFAIFSYFIASLQMLTLLIGFSILAGMSFSFYRVAAAPFYMRNTSRKERTHVFSFSFGMMLAAGMVGSIGSGKMVMLIGGWTGDIIIGYQVTLYIGILIGLLALIPFFLIRAARPSQEETRISISAEQLKRRGGFYFKIAVCNFIIGLGAGLIIPFLNLYFRDRFNLSPDTIGFYYFVVQFSMLLGSLSGPILVRKFGLVRTVVITQIASMPFMLILSYTYFLPLAFVAFVFRGGLMNLGVPLITNFGMELSEKREQGLVNALLMVAWTSSWMLSAAIGGRLIETYGYTVTMNITIVLYIIATATYYGFFRNAETRGDTSAGWIVTRDNAP